MHPALTAFALATAASLAACASGTATLPRADDGPTSPRAAEPAPRALSTTLTTDPLAPSAPSADPHAHHHHAAPATDGGAP